MGYEPGGRADKKGNEYENLYVASLLLKLAQEEILSVKVEPISDVEMGVDVVVKYHDNHIQYYQCKGRNGDKNSWSTSDLHLRKVFHYIKQNLVNNDISYYFISEVPNYQVNDICDRARNSENFESFYNFQLSEKLKHEWNKLVEYFEFDLHEINDLHLLYSILKRCFFELVPGGKERKTFLKDKFNMLFTGNAEDGIAFLCGYAVNKNKMGQEITTSEIIEILEKNGHTLKNLATNGLIAPRIKTLNSEFKDTLSPINNSIIHRSETEEIIECINKGNSAIVLGNPGVGKSGCLTETLECLDKKHIPYLALKLDKRVPENSESNYGKMLDLPDSPVYCLDAISGNKKAVIILDQLDSLRWTAVHSRTALDVCKEMINTINTINEDREYKDRISIILVCREFDYKYDAGLSSLNSDRYNNLSWNKIIIGHVKKEDVENIVGSQYRYFSRRLQKLLEIPINLYIWTKLDNKKSDIYSTNQLIEQWWQQIKEKAKLDGIDSNALDKQKDVMVDYMFKNDKLSTPKLLLESDDEIEYLKSSGAITEQNQNVSFMHQALFDYFCTHKQLVEILSHRTNTLSLPSYNNQLPGKRYQLTILLQQLMDVDEKIFVEQAKQIIASEDVRYYYKATIFEVAGQAANPSEELIRFMYECYSDSEWKRCVISDVIIGNLPYVKMLKIYGFIETWKDDLAYQALNSIKWLDPDFVVDVIKDYCFKDKNSDYRLYGLLCNFLEQDSDDMFQLRIQFVQEYNELLFATYGVDELIGKRTERAFILMSLVLQKHQNEQYYLSDSLEIYNHLIENFWKDIITDWLSIIIDKTKGKGYINSIDLHEWSYDVGDQLINRIFVDIVVNAFIYGMQHDIEYTIEILKEHYVTTSNIEHEIILRVMLLMPVEKSDFVLQWLCSDFNNNIFEYTGCGEYTISITQEIIKKHSCYCNAKIFQHLEQLIMSFHEEDEVCIYKDKLEYIRKGKNVYWAFFGFLQKALLPCLDINRISTKSIDLVRVLNRNEYLSIHHFNKFNSHGGFIKSPVDDKLSKLSIKSWVGIITNKEIRNGLKRHISLDFIESSCRQFANSFHTAMENEIEKFPAVVDQLPADIDSHYIYYIFYILSKDISQNIEFSKVIEWTRKFMGSGDREVCIAFADMISKRAEDEWPNDILERLMNNAMNFEEESYCIRYENEKDNLTHQALRSNMFNFVRSISLRSIIAILHNDHQKINQFKKAIYSAALDSSPAVRYAAIDGIAIMYEQYKTVATALFHMAIQDDIRVLCAKNAWYLMYQTYDEYKEIYYDKIIHMYNSEIEDISKAGAATIAALYLYKGDYELEINAIKTKEQAEGVCEQLCYCFEDKKYHDTCIKMFNRIINDESISSIPNSIIRLFYDEMIKIPRDNALIEALLKNIHKTSSGNIIYEYIANYEDDITSLMDILEGGCKKLCSANNIPYYLINELLDNITICISKILDASHNNEQIVSKCLNLWDLLYKSDHITVKKLTNLIEQKYE